MEEMEEMSYINAVRLDKGLEEGYTCRRCQWGGRQSSMRLMDLTALENHGRTIHRLNGPMLEDFMKDPQLDKRPSAPQTPIATEPQNYPQPTPIDDSAMIMALGQYNQKIGPNPPGALPPQTFNVPAHMNPTYQHQGVFHGQGNMGSLQMLPHPPNFAFHGQANQMGSPQMPSHPSNFAFHGQANLMAPPQPALQNHNPYWISEHVHGNQYYGSPPQQLQSFAHPMNYQEPANHHFQLGNQYQMHPPLPPEGYMTVVRFPEEAPQNQSFHNPHEAQDRIELQHASKILREGHYKFLQLHHDCIEERKDPEKAAQNPIFVGDFTLTEIFFFNNLYKDLGSTIEKDWLVKRYPKVYSAWQKWEFEKGQVRPPVVKMQLEANNLVNTSQRNDGTATNCHNSAASLKQHSTNQSSTTSGPAGVQNAILNNPFKEPHKSIPQQADQKILRQRSLSFQQSGQAAGTPSQSYSGSVPLQASSKPPGVNPSSLQQEHASQAIPAIPKSSSPTMDNQLVVNQTTDQDSSPIASPKSATPTLPIHSEKVAIITNPSAKDVSTTPGLASDLASTSHENVPKEALGSEASNAAAEGSGLASNGKFSSQVEGSRVIAASPQLQKKTNRILERKRQFGASENDGDSTSEGTAAKKPRYPYPMLPGSMAQPANRSQRLAETSMSNSSANSTAGNRDHSMPPPARPASQQPIHDLRDPNYRLRMGLEPIHNLSDVEYRQFLKTSHPNFDLDKVWSYDQLCAKVDEINKNQPGYLWKLFMRQFQPEHRGNLANCGLWPFFKVPAEFKDFDADQKTLYRKTALAELMALMLNRLHYEKGVFAQQLQEREEVVTSIMEERRKAEEEQKQKAEKSRKKAEEARRKMQEQRELILEEEEREDAERKKRLLDRAKEVVEEKYPPVVYEERCRMLVGCDPIFQLPDQRTWVKRQLEEEEYLKDMLDFERLTAEDWEYITTSNPEPIRQRSIPPVDNLDDTL